MEERFSATGLPVAACLSDLKARLEQEKLVALTAPPGSGKTIWAPLALWEQMSFETVYVLEPRRVTARLPALALSQIVGDLVGYRIRLESRWSEGRTRVGYLTYGTALRLFLSRPPQPEELVIFDEFHERSWEAELLLAFLRSRPQTRVLLMSATLEVSALPENTSVISSDGRLHPVAVSWESVDPQLATTPKGLERLVCERSLELFQKSPGEQLIFLPGLREMRTVAEALAADSLHGPVDLLHSSMPEQEIRRVVERPVGNGFRRILSTDLAESSVTLPGVTAVIDAGLVRRPVRDLLDLGPTLRTEAAPLASLEQRAGRAGRLGPGRCHRLFTRRQEQHRRPFPHPQLDQADFRTVVMFLAGARLLNGWQDLPWLYQPDHERISTALQWCRAHSVIDGERLTPKGDWVLSTPLSPRAALFAFHAAEAGRPIQEIISVCAALENPPSGASSLCLEAWLTGPASRRVESKLAAVLARKLESVALRTPSTLASVLLRSYSDTVCQFAKDRAVCAAPGQPALLFAGEQPTRSRYGVILATRPNGGQGPRSAVSVYHEVDEEELWETMLDYLQESQRLEWDQATATVREVRETMLGQLVLERSQSPAPPGPEVARLLRDQLEEKDLGDEFLRLTRRLTMYFQAYPEDFSEWLVSFQEPFELQDLSERVLLHYLSSRTQWSKSCPQALFQHAQGLMSYQLQQALERHLPDQLTLPGRRRPIRVEYPAHGSPYLESKLQDFFGWQQPRLLEGRVELTCHLLAPNGRACQITTNLAEFWKGSYQQVRKDLRGRYPKHPWPEDPTDYRHQPKNR